jgi:hypothetical protein
MFVVTLRHRNNEDNLMDIAIEAPQSTSQDSVKRQALNTRFMPELWTVVSVTWEDV